MGKGSHRRAGANDEAYRANYARAFAPAPPVAPCGEPPWPAPIVTDPGHPPFHGPWPKMARPTAPCAWCQEPITGPSWCDTPSGDSYHHACEHAASEAGRFRRLPGEKKSLQPRITSKAHPNDRKKTA